MAGYWQETEQWAVGVAERADLYLEHRDAHAIAGLLESVLLRAEQTRDHAVCAGSGELVDACEAAARACRRALRALEVAGPLGLVLVPKGGLPFHAMV